MTHTKMLLRFIVLLVMSGCVPHEPPLPPIPPIQDDDLSKEAWTAPTFMPIPPEEEEIPAPTPVRIAAPNEKLYHFRQQEEYTIPIRLGTPADIVLEPGEVIHGIVTGDRSYLAEGEDPRWTIKEAVSESEYTPIPHVFVTATHPGLRQGIVITTSRRTYHLTLLSVEKSRVRTVRWVYPIVHARRIKKTPSILPDHTKPQQYQVGYIIESQGQAQDFTPLQVLDDGAKTYILFSPIILRQDAPLLRLVGPNGPEVGNVRQFSTVYIVDRRIQHAELRVGVGKHAATVTIRRGNLRRIQCPGDEDCPQWPAMTASAPLPHP